MHEAVTTELAARCLAALQQADGPATAAGLARRLALAGCRETQRRHVRAIVQELREQGHRIVAANPEGYWLTEDITIWKAYLEGRQIDAKQIIGEAARRKKMTADATGQGLLFVAPAMAGVG
jgi:biotin operon repressor